MRYCMSQYNVNRKNIIHTPTIIVTISLREQQPASVVKLVRSVPAAPSRCDRGPRHSFVYCL